MYGFVSVVLPERHFGFIRFASDQAAVDPPLDRSVFFSDGELREFVQVGDRVAFEIVEEGSGRSHAVGVTLAEDDRLRGVVDTADPTAYHRHQFCFIHGDEGRQFYCAFTEVVPDCIGRRGLSPGTPVSFRVRPGSPGQKDQAVDIRNEDPLLANIDVDNYREFGRVETFNGDYGHIRRPCGDTLGYLAKNIITEGVEDICRGLWLEYAITVQPYRFHEDTLRFGHRVFARDIAVTRREERSLQMASVSPESRFDPDSIEAQWLAAAEAEPTPIPVPPPQPSPIYSPSERRLSIKQLIELRKQKAAA